MIKPSQFDMSAMKTIAIGSVVALLLSCGPKPLQPSNTTAPEPASRSDATPLAQSPIPPAPVPAAPVPAAPVPAAPRQTGDAVVQVTCAFNDGWFAVVPMSAAPNDPEYVMQALIGLTEDPGFWSGLDDYKALAPYAAQRCTSTLTSVERPAGEYLLYIGWAAGYQVTDYKNNGLIENLSLSPGASVRRHTEKEDLNADLPCISCPFLLAYLDGTFVELGQILIDRYNSGRAGTDRKTTRVSVEAGVVRVLLKEREPETSFINVVEVWADGNKLPPMATVPVALIVDDLASHIMKNGDEIELEFAAPIKRGYLNVEIRVSGYYQLDRFASVR